MIAQIQRDPPAPARAMVLAAVVMAVLASAVFAASARATTGYFCPPYPAGSIGLSAYGSPGNADRCAGANHTHFDFVSARNTTTPVLKCAVLKPNSDGSGGNVGGLSAVCAPGTDIATQYPGGLGGYPTIINQSGNYHTGFYGYMGYY